MLDTIGIKSIRNFIGSKDFAVSKNFYTTIGFEETYISYSMSYFSKGPFGFYLQDAYVKKWVDNTMIFLEVEELDTYLEFLQSLDLPSLYKKVKLSRIVKNDWGREFFLHDPSGVLWHIGNFKKE